MWRGVVLFSVALWGKLRQGNNVHWVGRGEILSGNAVCCFANVRQGNNIHRCAVWLGEVLYGTVG